MVVNWVVGLVGLTVEIDAGSNGGGSLVASIEVNKNGIFYTNQSINIAAGLYPAIVGETGIVHYMPMAATYGGCNSCHGITAERIWAN